MLDIPRLNLQSVQFVEPNITSTAYQFKPSDVSILERSLAQREPRMKDATQMQSNMYTALGKLETILHNDSETNQWFANYKANIEKQIQDEIDAGNYGSVARTATRLAGETAQNSGIIGRVQANIDYEKAIEAQRQRLAKGEIDNRIFNWWLEKNPYKYNAAFDSSGNEVRGKLADIKAPEAKLNFEKLWLMAAQMVEEEAEDNQEGNTFTNKPLSFLEEQAGNPSSTSDSTRNTYHKKTTERIQKVYNNLLNNSTIRAQLMQEFEVAKWDYKKLNEQLLDPNITAEDKDTINTAIKEYTPMLNRNGSPIKTYKEWLDKNNNQSPYARSLAYNRKSHSEEHGKGWAASNASNPGDPNRYETNEARAHNNEGNGPGVEMNPKANTNEVDEAASNVQDIMSGVSLNKRPNNPSNDTYSLPNIHYPTN